MRRRLTVDRNLCRRRLELLRESGLRLDTDLGDKFLERWWYCDLLMMLLVHSYELKIVFNFWEPVTKMIIASSNP